MAGEMDDRKGKGPSADDAAGPADAAPAKPLSDAAKRSLAEAEARRAERLAAEAATKGAPSEHGGRAGPDPVRYGDWENGGIASDF